MTTSEYVTRLIAKYEKRIDNLEWHIKTNKPKKEEEDRVKQRIDDFKEMLADLLPLA